MQKDLIKEIELLEWQEGLTRIHEKGSYKSNRATRVAYLMELKGVIY